MIPVLLLFHDVLSTALLVALSVQLLTAWAPIRDVPGFAYIGRSKLTDVVVTLFVLVILLGAFLYPSYRFMVRPYLESRDMKAANGAFEIKEHFAALALITLPAYRAMWRSSAPVDSMIARRVITSLLCAMVWWNFVMGHVMNFIRGISA